MQPELRWLRAFLAVAAENHFSKAAQRLNLAQPALTTQIKQLEESVGQRLFERTNRLIGLTPAGRVLVPEAQAIVDLADNLGRLAQRASEGELGRLRLGVIPPAATGFIAEALRGYARAWPEVDVQVRQNGQGRLESLLAAGELDVVIGRRPTGPAAKQFGVRKLVSEDQGVLLRADDPLASQSVIALKALDGRKIVLLRNNPFFGENLMKAVTSKQLAMPALRAAEDFPSLFWLVRAGLGIAPCSLLLADTLPASLTVRRVSPGLPRLGLHGFWLGKTPTATVHHWLEVLARIRPKS